MGRYRKKPADYTAPVPSHMTRHGGTGCPVPESSRPGVLFRAGLRIQVGHRLASEWMNYGQRDCWNWSEEPQPNDIIAFVVEEDEYVTVLRLENEYP